MNFYNPYYYSTPLNYIGPKVGLLQRLFGNSGISIGNFFNGTQRVLNFANQAIPIIKQVKPIFGNAKTMFSVMNEFKKAEKPIQKDLKNENKKVIEENNINDSLKKTSINIEGPTFFV